MRTPRDLPVAQRCGLTIVTVLVAATSLAVSAQSPRFALSGDARLATDTPVQTGGRFVLKAQLAAGATAVPEPQTDGRFALHALLTTSSLVCYNDTIFRDSFDASGF
jgi:hypothetical protein